MRRYDPEEFEVYMVWRRLMVTVAFRNKRAKRAKRLSDVELAQELVENLKLRANAMQRPIPQVTCDARRLISEMKAWSGVFYS
jgi:hypothetical protein